LGAESDSEDDYQSDGEEDITSADSAETDIEVHPSTAEAIKNFLSFKPSADNRNFLR
jgi:hypothetical protein